MLDVLAALQDAIGPVGGLVSFGCFSWGVVERRGRIKAEDKCHDLQEKRIDEVKGQVGELMGVLDTIREFKVLLQAFLDGGRK